MRDRCWTVRPPRPLQELAHRIERTREALAADRGRPVTTPEIARELGLEERRLDEALQQIADVVGVSQMQISRMPAASVRRLQHMAEAASCTPPRAGCEDGAVLDLADIVSVHPFGDRLEPGSGAGVVVLVAFLLSFVAIRTSARLTRSVSWWPGGVKTGGVHVHHLVWGICLLLLCGFLAFAVPLGAPWWHIIAIGFGVGAGFTLDEFALWVRLQDVYWAEEGRASFDAVVCTCAFAALVVVGTRPFGLDEPSSIFGTAAVVGGIVALAIACFAKGRVFLGVVGIFIPVVAAAGALRLAKPTSLWAKWRYDAPKLDRARRRHAMTRSGARARRRLADLIAGAPSNTEPAPRDESTIS